MGQAHPLREHRGPRHDEDLKFAPRRATRRVDMSSQSILSSDSIPEPAGYFLRPVRRGDEPAVQNLIEGILRTYGITLSLTETDADLADLEGYYAPPGASFDVLIGKSSGQIVGTVALEPHHSGDCELRKMYLDLQHRRRGLGKYLLSHAIHRARAIGYRRILAGTTAVLKEAINLYERFGFEHVDGPRLAARAELTMALRLDEPHARLTRRIGEYELREGVEAVDFIRVQRWLASSYWTPDIPIDHVIRAAQGSAMVLSAHHPDSGQVAYGRVISDRARFAYIGDIWVDEAHRGRGLARALVEFAIQHPELQQVRTWTLATRDAHAVYEPLGFVPMSDPTARAATWMVRRVGDAGWLKDL
jgi:GNAT superfamily N-acetyltransferase